MFVSGMQTILAGVFQEQGFRALVASMKTARVKYLDSGRLSNHEFAALLEIDPSPTKKYIDWLCESLIRNGGVTHDYAYSMPALIGQFYEMVENHLFPGVDLNKVEPSVNALKNLIQTQEKKYMERAFNLGSLVVGKDYEEIQSPSQFRIFRILSYKASKKLGSGTNWCIVPNETKFDEHFEQSHIYFVINKDNFKDKYAVTINRAVPSGHTTVVTIPENRDLNLRTFEEKTKIPVDYLVEVSK